ncbi:LamG domain-containing protein, partial [Candidatus Entotheonella palauensis]|uniref:LamG domain-containing protein n=1 Tax=Candidatus Entotheonella palauensis TaxID=93172 RepID=UPI0011789891
MMLQHATLEVGGLLDLATQDVNETQVFQPDSAYDGQIGPLTIWPRKLDSTEIIRHSILPPGSSGSSDAFHALDGLNVRNINADRTLGEVVTGDWEHLEIPVIRSGDTAVLDISGGCVPITHDFAETDALTLSLWIKTENAVQHQVLAYIALLSSSTFGSIYYDHFSLDIGGKIEFTTITGEGHRRETVDLDTNVADGQWHHVAIIWRNADGRVQFYVDGTQSDAGEPLAAGAKLIAGGSLILAGNLSYSGSPEANGFQGQLSTIGIWHRELTEDEIGSLTLLTPDSNDPNLALLVTPFTAELELIQGSESDTYARWLPGALTGPELVDGGRIPALELTGESTSYGEADFAPTELTATALTVSFYMRTDFTNAEAILLDCNNEFAMTNCNDLTFRIKNQPLSTGIAINDADWHHVAMTWDSADGHTILYIDGIQRFEGEISPGSSLNCFEVRLGQPDIFYDPWAVIPPEQCFQGRLGPVTFWNRVLAPTEIKTDMTFHPLDGGPVLFCGPGNVTTYGARWISTPLRKAKALKPEAASAIADLAALPKIDFSAPAAESGSISTLARDATQADTLAPIGDSTESQLNSSEINSWLAPVDEDGNTLSDEPALDMDFFGHKIESTFSFVDSVTNAGGEVTVTSGDHAVTFKGPVNLAHPWNVTVDSFELSTSANAKREVMIRFDLDAAVTYDDPDITTGHDKLKRILDDARGNGLPVGDQTLQVSGAESGAIASLMDLITPVAGFDDAVDAKISVILANHEGLTDDDLGSYIAGMNFYISFSTMAAFLPVQNLLDTLGVSHQEDFPGLSLHIGFGPADVEKGRGTRVVINATLSLPEAFTLPDPDFKLTSLGYGVDYSTGNVPPALAAGLNFQFLWTCQEDQLTLSGGFMIAEVPRETHSLQSSTAAQIWAALDPKGLTPDDDQWEAAYATADIKGSTDGQIEVMNDNTLIVRDDAGEISQVIHVWPEPFGMSNVYITGLGVGLDIQPGSIGLYARGGFILATALHKPIVYDLIREILGPRIQSC